MSCRSPATNYALFLLERYLLLELKAIRVGKPIEFNTTAEFVQCCGDQNEKVQGLLCELYLPNYFLKMKETVIQAPL